MSTMRSPKHSLLSFALLCSVACTSEGELFTDMDASVVAPADAAVADGGAPSADAGVEIDAATPVDAALTDAGFADAGVEIDAGNPDAGALDAGPAAAE